MPSGDRNALRGQGCSQGTGMMPAGTGTLTGDGGAVARLVGHDELVLEAAAPHALSPDQHQRFPAERRHPRHLLVDQQLVPVELWARDRAGTRPWGPQGTPSQRVPPPPPRGNALGHSPAFFVVRYIILFFLFPLRLPHRAPARARGWLSWGQGQGQHRGTGAGAGALGPSAGAGPRGTLP